MLEVAAMAGAVVIRFLVPLLTKGADEFADDLQTTVSKTAADKVVDVAKSLWNRVKSALHDDDERQAVALFEKNPEMMKGVAEELLKKRLEADPALRNDINGLLGEQAAQGSTVYQLTGEIIGVVDARHAHITGGEIMGVRIDAPSAEHILQQEHSPSADL